MRRSLRWVPLTGAVLLAACANVPSRMPRKPALSMPAVNIEATAKIHAARPTITPQAINPWEQLRNSFAMADCDASPSVLQWARRYTRNPRQFESQLSAVLPQLTYVQQIAARNGVAGEFVLLPWVESHFQPVPGRRNRPAGMWQIMPSTAGTLGLRVDGHYDGRLDVPAAAEAVMKLLKQYHDQFHDWRLVDYAYNAGEYATSKLVQKHGMPQQTPVIPRWPVRNVTREHLTKLLAMACVVREPERFGVTLPALPDEQQLVQVKLTRSMPFALAADHAGMAVGTLKQLNAAFRNNMIDADAASYLLLPADHARQFRDALLNQSNTAVASASPGLVTSHTAQPVAASPPEGRAGKTHKVKRGESLWQIARHYSVNVSQLQSWNHLHGRTLKPGQVLKVSQSR